MEYGEDPLGALLDASRAGDPRTGRVFRAGEGSGEGSLPLEALPPLLPPGPGEAPWVLPLDGDDPLPFLDRALERIRPEPGSFREKGIFPVFFTASRPGDGAVETRLLPSWRGLLPGDRYPAEVREKTRELFRLLQPARFPLFLLFENYALAGVDLHGEAEAGRFTSGSGSFFLTGRGGKARSRPRPWILAVCGIDGSGKSSHLAALRDYLEERGLKARVHKIYRHGVFHDTVTDLTRLCAGGKNLHLWRIQRLAKLMDSVKYLVSTVEPGMEEQDVLLFDRYLPTHFAAGTGRFHHDPYAREILSSFPRAHKVFLLDLPAEEAVKRLDAREERTVDENPYMLSRFREGLLDLARAGGDTILDARAPFEENQEAIRRETAALLGLERGGTG